MKTSTFIISAFVITMYAGYAQDQKQIVDLRGTWKFEIGDNAKYADPKFDDSKWDGIFVPDVWEDEGYPGYDGYAWYRKKFVIPSSAKGKNLYFNGGYIDDACAIYINGHHVGGKGGFPPHYETAYDQEEVFVLPEEFLNFDQENVVAIRVYDDFKYGGITRGKVGIFSHPDEIKVLVRLPDVWKFKTGDNEQWADPSFNDSNWEDLIVPMPWDYQGYGDYDGFGWYRMSVNIPENVQNEKLYIVLGKIDDIDEAYFNGTKIGATGHIGGLGWVRNIGEEYQVIRVYRIPSNLIKVNQKNVLAVRVYDKMKFGGICEGPIGIIGDNEYRQMFQKIQNEKREGQDRKSLIQKFLDEIFNDN